MAKDVVCGMDVDERQASAKDLTSSYAGQTYYFCSQQCKKQFDQEPQRYAAPVTPPEQVQRQTGEQYTGVTAKKHGEEAMTAATTHGSRGFTGKECHANQRDHD